jgi:hypothetical protein
LFFFHFPTNSPTPSKVHHIAPAQFPIKVKSPTGTGLNSLTPLYALDRSMDEMALVPPRAKKEVCERRRVVRDRSGMESVGRIEVRLVERMCKRRKRGMLGVRDWVVARTV